MNKEIIKAMNKKATKWDNFKKWWGKNGYKVRRVIFFPLWIGMVVHDKVRKAVYGHIEWSTERADEILNYYIPRASEWDAETKSFYFFDNGLGWNIRLAKRYLKLKDRRFWKKYIGWSGGEIRKYLINNFQLEGFTKTLGDCDNFNDYTELTFTMDDN